MIRKAFARRARVNNRGKFPPPLRDISLGEFLCRSPAATVLPVPLIRPSHVGLRWKASARVRSRAEQAEKVHGPATVESVEQIAGPGGGRGRRGLGGTHLTFKTSTETLEVHVGPTAFLNEKKVTIAKGDTLVITGSRVKVDDHHVFIAKEVKKGDSTWTLRNAAGLPLWRGGGRRQ
jgi:hypothetical protein